MNRSRDTLGMNGAMRLILIAGRSAGSRDESAGSRDESRLYGTGGMGASGISFSVNALSAIDRDIHYSIHIWIQQRQILDR